MKNHTTNKKANQSTHHPPCNVVSLGDLGLKGIAYSVGNPIPAIFLPQINVNGYSKPKEKEEGKERLFTLPKAAKYLGRTVWSMRHLAGKGSLPCVREGKRIFFDIDDLDKWIERNKKGEVGPPPSKKVSPRAYEQGKGGRKRG